MSETITQFAWIVVIETKSAVELWVKPYFRRSIILNNDPLTNIEFFTIDNERILDVFLYNILSFFS